MSSTLLLLIVSAALLSVAQAQSCECNVPIQKLPHAKSAIKFAVIGDWGRVGDLESTIPVDQGGTDTSGWCTNPANGFANTGAVSGGQEQIQLAQAMNAVCAQVQCQFIVNTGDNFYECGLDNPSRWITDFEAVYQSNSTPALRSLQWYGVFGNHDIVQNQSVPGQIAYGAINSRWFADNQWTREVHNDKGDVRLRFVAFNTNPFVTSYGKSSSKYNTYTFKQMASPQNLTSQIDYVNANLNSSHATWDIVIGHHPIFGGASANGYNSSLYVPGDSFDLGRPAADGTPSWTAMIEVLRNHTPVAYMNGHDHFIVAGRDALNETAYPTQYITSGAGSQPDSLCSLVQRPNVPFSYLNLNRIVNSTNCAALTAQENALDSSYMGFTICTASANEFRTDYYIINQYNQTEMVYSAISQRYKPAGKLPKGCQC